MNHLNWIETLPGSWEARPLRTASDYAVSNVDKITADNEVPVRLCNYSDVYHNEIINLGADFMRATATAEEIEKFRLEVGDVLITKDSESWNDIGVPALVKETAPDLLCGYHLALLRPRGTQLAGAFLFRCLQAHPIRIQLELAANGVTRFGLPKSSIGGVVLPIPPLSQQRAIADYLDRETARLDRLVAEKERVLRLFAEKRRALITRAVTRGLDPDLPIRDSGVPWVGEIPAHWETWKISHFATVGNGSTPSRDNGAYWAGGSIPWLNSSVVNRLEVTEADQFVTPAALRKCHLPLVKPDSVLVGITGQGKTRGRATVLTFEATINQHMAFITPHRGIADARFVRWALFSAYDYLRGMSDDTGSTKGALTCSDISGLRIALPPPREQKQIVAHIASRTAKLHSARSAIERTIALLKERRSAVITAAVTGRIDAGGPRMTGRMQESDDPAKPSRFRVPTSSQNKYARPRRFMDLWGTWPGDEPVDALLDQLD